MKKLTPVELSLEDSVAIDEQLNTQEATKAQPKSRDPLNYPVFEIPVNKKVLIYVPNHTVQQDGIDVLRMDKPLIHSITYGKNKFISYRCSANINLPGLGFNGECPLCDGCADAWDLANEIIADKCSQLGLDPEDTDNQDVKNIRSKTFSDRTLKDAERYYTFPIVVFETVNDDAKTLIKNPEDDGYVYSIQWYTISERQWEKTWKKTLEGMEDDPTHPGGSFFILNYCYTPKRGEPNKRDSAQNLTVSARKIKNSEAFRKALDDQTESWTPALARKYVIKNALYTPADLSEVAQEISEPIQNLLALYSAKKSNKLVGNKEESNEEGFKLEKKEEESSPVVDMGETDEDFGDMPIE